MKNASMKNTALLLSALLLAGARLSRLLTLRQEHSEHLFLVTLNWLLNAL